MERPQTNLRTQKVLERNYAPNDYEWFEYPGTYVQKSDGEQYASVRMDEFGTLTDAVQAESNARGVSVGALFTLERFPLADQNVEHMVLSATYDLQFSDYEAIPDPAPPRYACSFSAMTTKQPFRPRRVTPKPFVQGPQTATVVGPPGEQIYTDEYGRVKVKFHWDRDPAKDQTSSCWIRVSHPWAGKGWGSVATPRIGQEVIVDFLEGDPDQPIITGRVYNGQQTPPFGFPAGAVVSGFKSDTHKGSGYNEISADDTAGKEKITIHAQYDMGTTVLHDQNTTVNNDQTNTVHGKMTEVIDKDTSIMITTGKLEHMVMTGRADYFVNGPVSQSYNDTLSTTVLNKITVASVTNEIIIEGSTKITLLTGSSMLMMESNGAISLAGTKITINGKDAVSVSGAKTDVVGSTEAIFGTGQQTVSTNSSKTMISGSAISAAAMGTHEITGAVVKIN
jgi:type VI secretion system secreted protein VgrG